MPVPTISQLVTPQSTANGLPQDSVQERILTLLAMYASGFAPDGTPIPAQTVVGGLVADNGATDNQPALQAAVNALATAGGGVAVIPYATSYYGLGSPVIMPTGVWLWGSGAWKIRNLGNPPGVGGWFGTVFGPANNWNPALPQGLFQFSNPAATAAWCSFTGIGGVNSVTTAPNAPWCIDLGAPGQRFIGCTFYSATAHCINDRGNETVQNSRFDSCVCIGGTNWNANLGKVAYIQTANYSATGYAAAGTFAGTQTTVAAGSNNQALVGLGTTGQIAVANGAKLAPGNGTLTLTTTAGNFQVNYTSILNNVCLGCTLIGTAATNNLATVAAGSSGTVFNATNFTGTQSIAVNSTADYTNGAGTITILFNSGSIGQATYNGTDATHFLNVTYVNNGVTGTLNTGNQIAGILATGNAAAAPTFQCSGDFHTALVVGSALLDHTPANTNSKIPNSVFCSAVPTYDGTTNTYIPVSMLTDITFTAGSLMVTQGYGWRAASSDMTPTGIHLQYAGLICQAANFMAGEIHISEPTSAPGPTGITVTAGSGTATLTVSPNANAITPGAAVIDSGATIPVNTYVVSVNQAANTITLNQAVTPSGTLNFYTAPPVIFDIGQASSWADVTLDAASGIPCHIYRLRGDLTITGGLVEQGVNSGPQWVWWTDPGITTTRGVQLTGIVTPAKSVVQYAALARYLNGVANPSDMVIGCNLPTGALPGANIQNLAQGATFNGVNRGNMLGVGIIQETPMPIGISVREQLTAPNSTFGQTISRISAPLANQAALQLTGNPVLTAITLPAGSVIGHLNFWNGTTAVTTATHWWFALYDNSLNQLAVTADQAAASTTANLVISLPVATIASGASATFTTTYTGLYYIGYAFVTAAPTLLGLSNFSQVTNTPPKLCGTSSDAVAGGPPAFPHQAGAITGISAIAYAYAAT